MQYYILAHRGVLKRFYMQPNAIIFIMVGLAASRAIVWSNLPRKPVLLWGGPAESLVACVGGILAACAVGLNLRYAAWRCKSSTARGIPEVMGACMHVCLRSCMHVSFGRACMFA